MARDLSQLPLADLLEEARRRGIVGAESMEREALIEALTESDRRGPISFARALLGRVVRAVIPPTERRSTSERPPPRPAREPGAPVLPQIAVETLLDPTFTGLRAIGGDSLAIVWRLPAGALEGAQAIAHATADLRLHTLRVRWPEGESDVRVERTDHGSVRSEGALALPPLAPGEQLVAAIGLGSEDGAFVAALHASLSS